jgi:outer membrane protein TolC
MTAEFSQPLIDVGIPPSLRRGKLEVVLAQQNLNREVTERLHEARVTFLEALYLRDLIALYDEIDQRLQRNVDSEQQRFDVGMGNEGAVKSARIQELNQKLDLADLRNRYFTAITRLAELAGRDLRNATNAAPQLRLPKPVGALRYEPLTLDVRQELAYALQHRADLALLHALEEAIAADKQTVQAGYFPTVLLTASALLFPQSVLVSKQTSIVPGQGPRTTEEREGLSLTWRIVDNGQIIGASHRLEAVRQIYVTLQHQLEQNIPRELAAIKNQLQEADARHEALLKSAEAAEEGLQLIESRVTLGEATQYDFLKAQTSLLSVRASLVDTAWVHETARAELDRATGRYLQYHVETAQ